MQTAPLLENDGKVDLSALKDLTEDSILSTQPAMMVNLKACTVGGNMFFYQESPASLSTQHTASLRTSITPTKKIEMDRTIMPDGTVVTTVTTIQSRPKVQDCQLDSPSRSPSKVEVTEEKKITVLSESSCPSNTSPNSSPMSFDT